MSKLDTKQEAKKILTELSGTKYKKYVIDELRHLKGLEFIYPNEIKAANYAINILARHIKKLDKQEE